MGWGKGHTISLREINLNTDYILDNNTVISVRFAECNNGILVLEEKALVFRKLILKILRMKYQGAWLAHLEEHANS